MASLGSPTLDCFRNGSVVQLKSKITDRTLIMHQGGNVSGNGGIGFYAGCLGPRTPVWGRWTDGTYHRGTISNVDTQVHINFNDGDKISHDAHDQTAVIADINPDPEVVQDGSRVIAQFRGSARYYTGRVLSVNRADPRFPRYDIQFDDGDRGWAELNQTRVLPEITSSALGTPPILTNSRVLGRWTNNLYYRGKVTNVGAKIDIRFDDGDKIQHDPSDVSAVIYDVNPCVGTLQVGTRVIGFWPKSKKFYLGRVRQLDYMNPQFPRYFVQFDDGDQIWCNLNEVRPVPMRREQTGCVVWGRWTNNNYYHGRVTGTNGGKIHVNFDDGDKISHDQSDISAVLIDAIPNPTHVPVGSRVIAGWKDRAHYFKGRVAKVDSSIFYSPRYYIHYDDGDMGWQTFDKVRLLPMRVDEGEYAELVLLRNGRYLPWNACSRLLKHDRGIIDHFDPAHANIFCPFLVGSRVYSRWTNGLYFPGKVERVDTKIHIKFDDGDRIAHDRSDITAVVLDVNPDPGAVLKGSRVIGFWPKNMKFYSGYVANIERKNPQKVRYFIHYDDGDKVWATVDQLRLMPAPGPTMPAQFRVINMGGNMVALNNIAYPQFFLGIDNGRLIGKAFDNLCHFYIHETPGQYVSLESYMLPGQHIGVNHDGSMMPPANTYKNDQAFFEVKLLFSPYSQTYKADHTQHGGYPAPTPGYPQPYNYPAPHPAGACPVPPPGGYPTQPPGGYPAPPPGGYPTAPGGYPVPPPGGYPTPPPGGYPTPPPGGHPLGPHAAQPGYHPYPGNYPGYGPPPPYLG